MSTSTLTSKPSAATPPPLASPDLYRMTVDEYERIGGMLDDPRVELIDGYLVKKMSKNPSHIWTAKSLVMTLGGLIMPGWSWRKEDPVRIPDFDEPEPDIAIVSGSDDDYKGRIPEPPDVALVVEVAESTLERDQGRKFLAYAKGGIPVYWIVNLVDSQVEVYSDPASDGYRTRHDYKPGQNVPVVVGGREIGRIAVADILP